MAITTLDGVVAGMQGARFFSKASTGTMVSSRPFSLWGVGGFPSGGVQNATLNGGALTGPVNGQIPRSNPGSGNAYLARFTACSSVMGQLYLCDRLWSNQLTVNSTSAQNITFPGLPARDVNGSSNGDGVFLGIETSAAASATAAAITVTYTNQNGTPNRTANFCDAMAATATVAGAFFRIGLASGDMGVRSVQTAQFTTAWTSGTINMVAYRVIATVECVTPYAAVSVDALTSGMPRIFDGSVPYMFFVPYTSTAGFICGSYVETWG